MVGWDDLKVALAVARAGSVAAAARALGVDASTVSRRIGALEDGLGAALFSRAPDGLRPTEAGLRLLGPLEEAELALRRAVDAATSTDERPRGTVRVAVVPELAQTLLVPAVVPLLRRWPEVVVDVVAGVELEDIGRRAVDIAIRASRPASGDLVVKRLREIRLGAFAAPALLAREGHRDLRRLPWVSWSERADWPEARWVREHFPDVRVVFRANSMTPLRVACARGLGAAVLAETVLVTEPALERLELGVEAPAAALWAVGHRTALELAHVRVVWDHLCWLLAERSLDEDRALLAEFDP